MYIRTYPQNHTVGPNTRTTSLPLNLILSSRAKHRLQPRLPRAGQLRLRQNAPRNNHKPTQVSQSVQLLTQDGGAEEGGPQRLGAVLCCVIGVWMVRDGRSMYQTKQGPKSRPILALLFRPFFPSLDTHTTYTLPTYLRMTVVSSADTCARATDSATTASADVTTPV